jgi:hypothetical protein
MKKNQNSLAFGVVRNNIFNCYLGVFGKKYTINDRFNFSFISDLQSENENLEIVFENIRV